VSWPHLWACLGAQSKKQDVADDERERGYDEATFVDYLARGSWLSDRRAQPSLRTKFNEAAPRFSPDGRWLAYVSDESGRYEIYVQP